MAAKLSNFDFGGYATKYNILCTDGRRIRPGAFKTSNGAKLPLVWAHLHDGPQNVLGHVMLEDRDDGMYAYAKFNDSSAGKDAKTLVKNGDIESLSIYANRLVERDLVVHTGQLREVSLVLSGANPGAKIDHVNLQHSDGSEEELDDEAVIYSDSPLEFPEESNTESLEDKKFMSKKEETLEHADGEETLGDVIDSMNEKQRNVMYALIARAIENGEVEQSDNDEGDVMKHNVFEGDSPDHKNNQGKTLTHDDMNAILKDGIKRGSLKEAVLAHAGTYGIDNIGYLFPDARAVTKTPDWLKRDTGWVSPWMSGTRHLPFSRIKSWYADITAAEARAKGYITGGQKVEEVFPILKRSTDPTTVYKKQKLDRDDIIDITDFDVVAWMKAEMRMMLDEELARAALIGDGRTFGVDDDAIDPSKVRPILGDDPVYVEYVTLEVTVTDYADIIDDFIAARGAYKGTGQPTMYIDEAVLVNFLLLKDTTGRRIYRTTQELANELRVANIVNVDVLNGVQRVNAAPAFTADVLAIFVNPTDYSYGADKGGNVGMFDDFDIDYNQYKYLIETRLSGALTKVKSAMVLERKTA